MGARLEGDLGLSDQRPAGHALRHHARRAPLAAVVVPVRSILVAGELRVSLEEVALDAALAAAAAAAAGCGGARRPTGASGRRVFIVGHAAGGPRQGAGLGTMGRCRRPGILPGLPRCLIDMRPQKRACKTAAAGCPISLGLGPAPGVCHAGRHAGGARQRGSAGCQSPLISVDPTPHGSLPRNE